MLFRALLTGSCEPDLLQNGSLNRVVLCQADFRVAHKLLVCSCLQTVMFEPVHTGLYLAPRPTAIRPRHYRKRATQADISRT